MLNPDSKLIQFNGRTRLVSIANDFFQEFHYYSEILNDFKKILSLLDHDDKLLTYLEDHVEINESLNLQINFSKHNRITKFLDDMEKECIKINKIDMEVDDLLSLINSQEEFSKVLDKECQQLNKIKKGINRLSRISLQIMEKFSNIDLDLSLFIIRDQIMTALNNYAEQKFVIANYIDEKINQITNLTSITYVEEKESTSLYDAIESTILQQPITTIIKDENKSREILKQEYFDEFTNIFEQRRKSKKQIKLQEIISRIEKKLKL